MISDFNTFVNESQKETYFDTFSSAVQYAKEQLEEEGYVIDEDDWFREIGTGGKYTRSRPSTGDTHRFSIDLIEHKRGGNTKMNAQIQVYSMENGKYELNYYVK